ncbi:triose-phosphate isomerase [Pseudomonas sp. CrR25]|nr:triose-phosphate isomerase [Pseudomonas sp. CrR25]
MKRMLVIGNWKMHGNHQANAQLLNALLPALVESAGVETAVCPPYPYLAQVAELLAGSTLQLGAQNLSRFDQGAHTGEVSGHMLREFGCQYVLVGHSERRSLYGEDDRLIAEKFAAALCADLVPVLCVGESLAQRRNGETEAVITAQIRALLDLIGIQGLAGGVIAYEPVWAIGTGETATPAQAQAVHVHIRCLLAEQDPAVAAAMRILYGGSVKANNAAELFAQADIDGGLIGGASLDAASFAAICAAAQG